MFSLIDRVINLSHPLYHKNNFNTVIKILLDNGYPLSLIFSMIRKRLKSWSHNKHKDNKKEKEVPSQPYFVIPYVSQIADKFIQYFNNISFSTLAFACYNKLKRFIKAQKDSLPTPSRPDVVYRINCLDCDASYVGQTKRCLNVRVSIDSTLTEILTRTQSLQHTDKTTNTNLTGKTLKF